LLSEAADPARRIKSLYFWIDDAATPGQIELALRLARALGEHGVLLVPIAWDRETRSLTTALDRVAPASISWGKGRPVAAWAITAWRRMVRVARRPVADLGRARQTTRSDVPPTRKKRVGRASTTGEGES